MNILRIAAKEIRQGARNPFANAIVILLPLVMTAIIGSAMVGIGGGAALGAVRVTYAIEGDGALGAAFRELIAGARGLGVTFTEARREEGIRGVRDAASACHLEVMADRIVLVRNARAGLEAGFVQALVAAFLERHNAVSAIAAVRPAAAAALTGPDDRVFVQSVSLEGSRKPRSLDYYAVGLLTFIIMNGALFAMLAVRREKTLATQARILSAPVRRWQFLAGKVTGLLAVMVLQVAAVLVFSRFVLGAYWGNDMPVVGLVLLSEAIMAVSLGVGVGYAVRNEGVAVITLNAGSMAFGFLAGCIVPLSILGPVFTKIAELNPLGWVNKALFGVIYGTDYTAAAVAIAFCLGVSAVFLAITARCAGRES
jgi:ABC-2 type transport system permease protein